MFRNLPPGMLARMQWMEVVDARDRVDGTPIPQRLRQISPQTGRFLAILAANAPAGAVLEVGTSGGYSSMWLSLACQERGDRLTTFEIQPDKVALARETFATAGVEDRVAIIQRNALEQLPAYPQVAFCFLDAEKNLYQACYDIVVPNLVPGGILAADNVISHQEVLQDFVDRALADARVDAVVVPIGKGVLVCRKAVMLLE